MNKTYEVKGMTCVICKNNVEKGLKKLEGVSDCQVNLMDNEATVTFDEAVISEETMAKALKEAGYELVLKKERKADIELIKFVASLLLMGILMVVSMTSMHHPMKTMYYQLVLSAMICGLNSHFYLSGFRSLKALSPNMDALVSISSVTSFLYSLYAMYKISHGDMSYHLYFETAAMILIFVSIGKRIEGKSKKKTTRVIRGLSTLIPMQANLVEDDEVRIIPIDELKKNDIILIKAGESIPQDGIVIKGESHVDESLITGESQLSRKTEGSEVIGGTVNFDGQLYVKVSKNATQTVLSKIISLTKQATLSKIPIERIVDKIANYFVFTVIGIALVVFVIWMVISKDVELALNFALSVLVISCPCALGLATPAAITVASGVAASGGVLIKNPEILEIAGKLKTVIVDKTGTLTENKLSVIEYREYDKDFKKVLIGLEKNSNHPIANAIRNGFKEEGLNFENIKEVSGEGIISNDYYAGNAILLKSHGINLSEEDLKLALENSYTYIGVGHKDKLLGIVYLADEIKKTSKEAVQNLKDKGIKVIMATGDNELVAKAVSNKLGINEYLANVKPVDKENVLKDNKQHGLTAMVGDGINDAIALSSADVSFTLNSGTDIASASSDVILMHNDLNDINFLIDLSKKTMKVIKQNLFWALLYNSLCIPIAAGALYSIGFKLNPMIGSATMWISSIVVLTNAQSINKLLKEKK